MGRRYQSISLLESAQMWDILGVAYTGLSSAMQGKDPSTPKWTEPFGADILAAILD